mgnify:CR=1 FL=1
MKQGLERLLANLFGVLFLGLSILVAVETSSGIGLARPKVPSVRSPASNASTARAGVPRFVR